jgi:hypothetical protein
MPLKQRAICLKSFSGAGILDAAAFSYELVETLDGFKIFLKPLKLTS